MSKLTERKNIMILCFSILLLIFFSVSHAQDYPKGTVQLVVPFAPGGAVDIFWRTVIDLLSKNLNGTIAILNKPGGGGVVGTSFVVNSKPDGYTIGGGPTDVLIFAPLFTPNIHFDVISDLTYIAKLAFWPQIVIVRADSPFKTLQDLISFAKANPKKLKAGTPGPGTAPHMALHLLNNDARIEIVPVIFGGAGEIMPQLLGGHIDLAFMAPSPAKSQFKAGKIRILAFFSRQRHPVYPDIPTSVEMGLKNTIITGAIGLVGPKGLPFSIVKKWEEASEKTINDSNIISALQKFDYVVDFKRGDEFKKEVMNEITFFRNFVEKTGLKSETK